MRKPYIVISFLLIVLLCFFSCAKNAGGSESTDTAKNSDSGEVTEIVTTEADDTESIPDYTDDSLSILREQFDGMYSIDLTMEYTDIGVQGFDLEITQTTASDGSFRYKQVFHQWDHVYEYDNTSTALYYYRYENGKYVCYSLIDGEVSKGVMTKDQIKELELSYKQKLSSAAFLPECILGFHETAAKGQDGERSFEFTLALKDVQSSGTFLETYFNGVFDFFGNSFYETPGLTVYGTLTCDNDLHPKALSYDLSGIEPYVQSLVAWSEASLDCLDFNCTFNFDIAEHVDLPEEFK